MVSFRKWLLKFQNHHTILIDGMVSKSEIFFIIVQQAVVNRTVKFYQGFEKVALQYETSFIATCVSCLLAQPVKSINQTIKLNRDNFLSSFHIKILVLHVFCQVCMHCSSILKVKRQLVFLHCFDT